MTHTPGPWKNKLCNIVAADGRTIAIVVNPGQPGDASLPCDANANLIAAAPDMLRALRSIEQTCRIASETQELPGGADWKDFARAHADLALDIIFLAEQGLCEPPIPSID